MKNTLRAFFKDKSGATAIEYGLIGTLVAISIIAGVSALGSAVEGLWGGVANKVEEAGVGQ